MKGNIKRFLTAAILIAALSIAPAAYADDSDILASISLTPGSSTIKINGTETQAEAPYISENGVTLVPLRVICEAFNATADWNEENRTVTIQYNEVNVVLTIGSKAADVNGHTEELEAAPELSNDTTMVPLRFLAETFGAKVEYDEETQLITVTLYEGTESDTLRGMHDNAYIGNSYYGWSMKTPQSMDLLNKSFNSSSLTFMDEYANMLSIGVYETDEDTDPSSLFEELKNALTNYIISAAEMSTDASGNPVIHISAHNDSSNDDVKIIITDKYIYQIAVSSYTGILGSEEEDKSKSALEDLISLTETFSLTTPEDMYDFSDVTEGKREYTDEDYKITLSVPESYMNMNSYLGAPNTISFGSIDDDYGALIIEIYSMPKDTDLRSYTESELERDKEVVNPNVVKVSDIEEITVNDSTAYAYDFECSSKDYHYSNYKAFFTCGDYVYIITASAENKDSCLEIIGSLHADELDSEQTGTILRNIDMMNPYTVSDTDYKLDLPRYWAAEKYGNSFYDSRSNSELEIIEISDKTKDEMEEYIENTAGVLENRNYAETVSPFKWESSSTFSYVSKENTGLIPDYVTYYGKIYGDKAYLFIYTRSELYYGSSADNEYMDIINSFTPIDDK